jgi:hypothetical protein
VLVLQLLKQSLRPPVRRLQAVDKLQEVLIAQHVRRHRRLNAEEVVHDRMRQAANSGRQVRRLLLGGIRERDRAGLPVEAHEIDRLLEHQVEVRRQEQREIGDLGQLTQHERRLQLGALHDVADAGVQHRPPTAAGEMRAHDRIQGQLGVRDRQPEVFR